MRQSLVRLPLFRSPGVLRHSVKLRTLLERSFAVVLQFCMPHFSHGSVSLVLGIIHQSSHFMGRNLVCKTLREKDNEYSCKLLVLAYSRKAPQFELFVLPRWKLYKAAAIGWSRGCATRSQIWHEQRTTSRGNPHSVSHIDRGGEPFDSAKFSGGVREFPSELGIARTTDLTVSKFLRKGTTSAVAPSRNKLTLYGVWTVSREPP
jgi:hypothetical protein